VEGGWAGAHSQEVEAAVMRVWAGAMCQGACLAVGGDCMNKHTQACPGLVAAGFLLPHMQGYSPVGSTHPCIRTPPLESTAPTYASLVPALQFAPRSVGVVDCRPGVDSHVIVIPVQLRLTASISPLVPWLCLLCRLSLH
jgi:hypothetical protein